jgi:GTP-binding protein Era
MFKSGFVAILGRPNVGKSTLLNALTGEKISITSAKPQTTRNTIKAIITDDDSQVVFLDTPGIHKPKTKLGEFMMNEVSETTGDVDAIIFITEATEAEPSPADIHVKGMIENSKCPVFLVLNKIDLVEKQKLLQVIEKYSQLMRFTEIIPVSAQKNDGVDLVMKRIKSVLPEGPKYFPEDEVTDQPEKQIAAEIIREKLLMLLSDEVPHGTGVEVTSFKDRENKPMIDILANIYCEKDSHKAIIIGKKGEKLKRIGSLARKDIERVLATPINLQLWVKVKPDWRNSDSMLKILGYKKQT